MTTQFTPLPKETVMCTVQGCPKVATFVYTGGIDCRSGGHSLVAAYCDGHAEQTALQLGHAWPIPDRRPQERAPRALATRAS